MIVGAGKNERARTKYCHFYAECSFTKGQVTVLVHIIRLEDETEWTLEVVNSEGTSTVWDEPFENDADACAEFKRVVAKEGMGAFDGSTPPVASNVIPFRRPQ